MFKKLITLSLLCLLPIFAYADTETSKSRTVITEEDGSPYAVPWKIKFPNTSLTKNSDGTASVGYGGSDLRYLLLDQTTPQSIISGTPIFTRGLTVGDSYTLGLGTGKGLIQFDDETTDYISLMNANVGIGTTTPVSTFEVNGSSEFDAVYFDDFFRGTTDMANVANTLTNGQFTISAINTPSSITVDDTTGFLDKGFISMGSNYGNFYYGSKTATTFANIRWIKFQGNYARTALDNTSLWQSCHFGITNINDNELSTYQTMFLVDSDAGPFSMRKDGRVDMPYNSIYGTSGIRGGGGAPNDGVSISSVYGVLSMFSGSGQSILSSYPYYSNLRSGIVTTTDKGIEVALPFWDRVAIEALAGTYTKSVGTPTGLTVTAKGTTGATNWGYRVSATSSTGETLACSEVTISNGNATLSSSNYNQIVWTNQHGIFQYKIYRTTSGGTPATTGLITTVYPSNEGRDTNVFNDTGYAGDSSSVPTADTSDSVGIGDSTPDSKLEVAGAITLQEMTAPATPAANKVVIYVDSADGDLKAKDDNGEVIVLADFAVD